MGNFKILVRKTFTNPAILYVISRYGTYFIQFVNSLFIAIYLGPYYLGIWGFINLVLGYLAQINLGIPHSINVIVSVNKEKEDYVQKVIGNGLSMIVGLSIAIIFFFVMNYVCGFNIGEKYNFNTYIIPVCIIAVLTHFNGFFSNIFRIYGKVAAIAINQSLYPIIVLLAIPFFRGTELLWAMVIANCLSVTISLALFLVQSPTKLKLLFDFSLIKYIQIRGWHLFIYNASFYLILLSTKSLISSNYSIEEFGYFTFSYSLANTILLLLNSISYLIFPKMLNRFAKADNNHVQSILGIVRNAYISLSHLLIHFVIMMFPALLLFFPDYQQASTVFKVTALTVVLYTNSFGYQGLLMARGKEKLIAIIAFSALMLNIILSIFFVFFLKVEFSEVLFATLITYLIYVLTLGLFGRKELLVSASVLAVLKDVFPIRMFFPFVLSILFIVFEVQNIYFSISFIIYLFLNFKDLIKIKDLGIRLVNNQNFINI
ncbi:MAG: oligosaccharide flippase family protein [Bacteroidaceae bacterium]|jgi:O-antigen/teichoic acid export membrane protein|nr:oligosaccharide flippase family protein [Bacteroidaceae bacterium]